MCSTKPSKGGGIWAFIWPGAVTSCQDNLLLFAGTEAEWDQELVGSCDSRGNDGLCDGERMLALADCYTVITKADTETEADFLATHWDPLVADWKLSHSADND